MKKNVASQSVGCQMTTIADGSPFTGSVTIYVTGDNGTQAVGSVGSGACAHEGGGWHSYAPAQAETNYDHVAFQFRGTGAFNASVQIYTSFPQTGDSYARIGANGAGLTALPWNAAWDAEVQSECDDALVAQNLDHLVKVAVDTDFPTTVHANSVIGYLADNGAGYDRTTDSLEALRDNIGTAGAGLTNIDLPNQTMDITGNITGNVSGSVGSVTGAVGSVTGNVGGNVTGSVGSVVGNVGGNVTGSVGSVVGNVGGNVNGTINGLTAVALKDFFDTDSTTTYASAVAGSVVKEIVTNAGGVGGGITAADVWTYATRTLTALDEDTTTVDLDNTIRSAVGMASANLDTQLAAIKADTTAILIDTNELQTDWTNGGRLDLIIDEIKADVDSIISGGVALTGTSVDAIFDEVIEGSWTFRQSIRLHNAAMAGKASGLDTTQAKYRDLDDTKDRINATVDVNGNRSAIVRDVT